MFEEKRDRWVVPNASELDDEMENDNKEDDAMVIGSGLAGN